MLQDRLENLYDVARRAGRLLILTHNNPDPDAIASALAFRHLLAQELGIESPVAYHGLVGRAENKALLRYLGQPLQPLASRPSAGPDLQDAPLLALVNAQPGVGNISLPPGATVIVVIDHHTPQPASEAVPFADVRPELGATSTILTSYLRAAGLEPPPPLATALFYGIKTNTLGLGRNTSPADANAFFYLRSRIDIEALAEIEHAQVPPDYFHSFDLALRVACLHGSFVFSYIGPLSYPDLAAEMADVLPRLERAQWVLCLGVYDDTLFFSTRTRDAAGGAEAFVQALAGEGGSAGGQRTLAAGQIPLEGRDPYQVAEVVRRRALRYLDIPPDALGEPLI